MLFYTQFAPLGACVSSGRVGLRTAGQRAPKGRVDFPSPLLFLLLSFPTFPGLQPMPALRRQVFFRLV